MAGAGTMRITRGYWPSTAASVQQQLADPACYECQAEIAGSGYRDNVTPGFWHTEAAAVDAFDQLVAIHGNFHVRHEVTGIYVPQPVPGTLRKARIDRILIPTDDLLDQGWDIGPVGVECKRSHEKIGRAIAQAIDYRRAMFDPDGDHLYDLRLDWVFLWPMRKLGGAIASVMAQQRVGGIDTDDESLMFRAGQDCLIELRGGGLAKINSNQGRRVGSR